MSLSVSKRAIQDGVVETFFSKSEFQPQNQSQEPKVICEIPILKYTFLHLFADVDFKILINLALNFVFESIKIVILHSGEISFDFSFRKCENRVPFVKIKFFFLSITIPDAEIFFVELVETKKGFSLIILSFGSGPSTTIKTTDFFTSSKFIRPPDWRIKFPMKKVLNQDGLTLGYFIIKSQSRRLLLKYFRLVKKIPDHNLKKEILEQIKDGFRGKIGNKDEELARFYLKEGEDQFENLEKLVMMTNVK